MHVTPCLAPSVTCTDQLNIGFQNTQSSLTISGTSLVILYNNIILYIYIIALAVLFGVCFISLTINMIILVIYFCNKSKFIIKSYSRHIYILEQKQSSSSVEVHTIPPTADYDNFHPSTTTLQIQDCSAYGVVTGTSTDQ